MGGYISWNYSLSYPSRVEKMVLIDAAGYAQPLPELIAFGSHPLVRPVAKFSTPSFLVSRGISQAYGDPSKLKDEVKERYIDLSMREGNREAIAKIFQIAREKFLNPDISKRIAEVTTPTLVMWGTEDHWLKYEYFPYWKRDLKTRSSPFTKARVIFRWRRFRIVRLGIWILFFRAFIRIPRSSFFVNLRGGRSRVARFVSILSVSWIRF